MDWIKGSIQNSKFIKYDRHLKKARGDNSQTLIVKTNSNGKVYIIMNKFSLITSNLTNNIKVKKEKMSAL